MRDPGVEVRMQVREAEGDGRVVAPAAGEVHLSFDEGSRTTGAGAEVYHRPVGGMQVWDGFQGVQDGVGGELGGRLLLDDGESFRPLCGERVLAAVFESFGDSVSGF